MCVCIGVCYMLLPRQHVIIGMPDILLGYILKGKYNLCLKMLSQYLDKSFIGCFGILIADYKFLKPAY